MSPGLIEPPSRWGLFPDPAPGEPMSFGRVARHWFVQFNPLYFLSALCVLGGVYLVNRSLDRLESGAGLAPQLALFAVVQAYELSLVAGAAFLVRRAGAIRPAVLLLLLEALFLFDGTLRLESLLLRRPGFAALTVAWLILTMVKVWAAAAALRVPLTARHYVSIAGGASTLAVVIHLLAEPTTPKPLVLQVAAWLGTFVLLALDLRESPPVSHLAETEDARERAARCSRGAFCILAGAYFYHLWTHILVGGVHDGSLIAAALPQLGALFLCAALVNTSAAAVWFTSLLVVMAAFPAPEATPYALFLVAAVCAWRVAHGLRGGLATAAVLAAYAGSWLLDWPGWSHPLPELPALISWPTLVLATGLAVAAWTVEDRLAAALLAAGGAQAGYRMGLRVLPRSELGIGIVLLAAGFTFFVAGLAVNWWLRGRIQTIPARRAART